MTTDISKYLDRTAFLQESAQAMYAQTLGLVDGAPRAEWPGIVQSKCKETIFDGAGDKGPSLLLGTINALESYRDAHDGQLPSSELMSSMHSQLRSQLAPQDDNKLGKILDSAGAPLSTSEGVELRDHRVALIVPTALMMVTNDMVTTIPGNYDKSELFALTRHANSDFGDMKKGDVIDETFNKQYGTMDQRRLVGTGDGTKKQFTLSSTTDLGKKMPFKPNMVMVYVDRELVGSDDGKGGIFGRYVNGDGDTVVLTGTVAYEDGGITTDFSTGVASGLDVHFGFDINIESDPSLIPGIEHRMESWTLRPHESALGCSSTIQAQFSMGREFGMNLGQMNLSASRNVLASERDRNRLMAMYFFAKGETEWSRGIPSGLNYREHYQSLNVKFQEISQKLMLATRKSGMVGMVCGGKAAALLRSLGHPLVKTVPGYRHIAQPHLVGTAFGYVFKEDPYMDDPWGVFCYAKGASHGDAGFVAGDAITMINFPHSIQADLKHKNTLYDLAYRDLHPKNGRSWFTWLRIVD